MNETPVPEGPSAGRRRRTAAGRRSLMVRLVGSFLLLSVLMVVIVGAVAFTRARASLERSVFDRLTSAAELKGDSIDRWIDEQRRNVVFVAGAFGGVQAGGALPGLSDVEALLTGAGSEAEQRDAYRSATGFLAYVVSQTADAQEFLILNLEGEVVVATLSGHEGVDQSEERYFVEGGSATWVEPVRTNPLTGAPTITISTPLFDRNGLRVGVLAANLNIERLDRIVLEQTGLGATGETYLVGSDTRFVHARLSTPEFAAGVSSTAIDAALRGESGQGLYENYRGEPVIGVHSWLDEIDAALIAEQQQSEAFEPARQLALSIFGIGLAVVAILGVGIYWVSRRIARPILAITETATAVSAGDLTREAPVTTADEVGTLAAAFNDMTAQLRDNVETLERRVDERTAELTDALHAQREAEERYRRLVEELPLVVYTDKPDITSTSTYISPRVEEMFGYTQDAWLREDFFASVIHPDDRERVLAESVQELFGGNDRTSSEYRLMAADGRAVWVRDEQWIVRDDDGEPIHIQGFMADITEQTLAEAEIRRQKQYFESLVEISPVAVVTMDRDEIVTGWNPSAERLFRYGPDEAIGRHIDEIVPRPPGSADEPAASDAGDGGGTERISKRVRKDGSLVDVEILVVPLVVDGERVGSYAIYHDVSELQEAREAADAANEAKSAFLAAMSHEIRTPMNAIIGMSGLLLDTPLNDEQRDYTTTIATSGEALLTIINDILDFSKIEAGKMELEEAPFDLRQCVEGVMDLIGPLAAGKGLDLAYEIEPGTPEHVIGDVGRLRQILLNLLNNAVKFTETGEVVLSVASQANGDGSSATYRVAVRDTGIGVPPDRTARLFQSFSQADVSTSRRYGGTGLGLAISKRLAELMGGSMWVESEGIPGHGSTFAFTFRAPTYEPAAPVEADDDGAVLRGTTVLLVDDNATNRRILTAQLEAWGVGTVEAESGEAALARLADGVAVDAAILDLLMPGIDGVEAATRIRALVDRAELPLVLLSSADRREEIRARAVEIGFAATLTKPVRHHTLRAVLAEALGGGAARREEVAMGTELDPELGRTHPLRILLAEDNAVNQKLALRVLEKMGYRADVAGNGVETIEAIDRQTYDLILMDVQMPEMDGLEATRRIIASRGDDRPRIVAMTADAMAGDRERCLAAGMDDYITKPIRNEELAGQLGATPRRDDDGSGSADGERASAADAEPGAGAIDASVLDRLVADVGGGDAGFVGELLDAFFGEAPTHLDAIDRGLATGDAESVRRAAHTLKSNAATFGATALEERARELEGRARDGDLEGGGDLASGIRAAYAAAAAALAHARDALTAG